MATRSKPLKLWDAEKFKNVNPVSLKYWDRYETDMGIRDLSPSTVYNYESDFKQWMIYVLDNQGNAPVTELEEEDIEEFLFYCKKHGNNSARMKRRMSTISALYRYLRKKKIIKENPMEFIDRPTKDVAVVKQTYLTPDEVKLMREKLNAMVESATTVHMKDMANVGDQIDNATTASSYLISAMQGFGLVADDAERLLDCMNQIANTEPVSMNDLGIIMQKSSAAMSAAGNTYQETLSLAAAVNGVLQDADTSGTYLKTLSMYLRASKTDAENAGIATDGMADSVSELRSELKQLAGVDIMKDNNTFKSTYQIMKELSEVWKNLSDTTQANITELISGKRGGQSTSALLNNFSVAEDAMKQALNSSGSAMRENQTYMDSLQAKLNQLDSAFQKFSTDLMKSDIPKFFVDLATVFVDGADNAVKFAGALPTLTAAISGVLSVMQMSGKLKNGAGKVNMPSYVCCV